MRSWILATLLLIPTARLAAQNIGINANGATPNASAILDIDVSALVGAKKGLLIPRVTTVERNAIATPATSLLIFNTTTNRFEYFDGLAWVPFVGGGTLDQAYDFGGAGAGRTITADAGAVLINGTDGLISTGTIASGAVAPSGAGTRMVWNPNKAAFRVGTVSGVQWDNINIAPGSVAMGTNTRASGNDAIAVGNLSLAAGAASTAFGNGTTANGAGSFAVGTNAVANNTSSSALGNATSATGINSLATGSNTTASGGTSTAMGSSTTASGSFSTALGVSTTASAANATAMGQQTIASGESSTAMGRSNTAPSFGESVLGIGATTYATSVNGVFQFRAANATDRLLVVGNATDANNNDLVDAAERSDALVMLKNGNTGLGTSAPATRLHVVGNIRMVDGNQALGRVLTSDANGTATWQALGAASNDWTLLGNAGTNPATNFIGTTDNQDVVLRRNNVVSGRLGSTNTSYGVNTLTTSTGIQNTAIGMDALRNNTSGFTSTAIGAFALTANTTGTNNTATGRSALFANTTGGANTANGEGTLGANTTGSSNTALGFLADVAANNLSNATALGARAEAGASNSMVLGSINGVNGATSDVNVGIGTTTPADRLHVVGNIRMVDGNQALGRVLVSNANGTATWTDPLAVATGLAWTLTGNAGTNPATNFVGTTDAQPLRLRTANTFAGNIANTPTGLVSLGLNAGPASTGLSNTFVGGTAGVVNTTGANNTFLGQGAGAANTTTSNNTYVGMGAGQSNTTGQQNVYIGRLAGGNGATGSDNILIGNGAGILNTANNNVMVGTFAGNANSSGGGNTFLGTSAGSATTTGGQNTFVGTGAGSTNSTGTQNTLIGNGAALNANNLTNATAIGRSSRVDVNNGLVLGSVNGINAATSTSLVGIGTTAPLDRLHVVGNIRMVDGNQALGRVLTSDANGTATWQTASAGGTTLDGAYDFGGAGVGRTITADAGAVTIAGTDGFLTTGTSGSGANPEVVGAGTRMFFNPRKAAFRAGEVNGAQWNTANVGDHSVAMGLNPTASGAGAVALGEDVAATALGSAAIGFSNTASGTDSKAIGSNLIASGPASIALGNDITTSGTRSAGLGDGLLARSRSEVVLGMNNTDYVPNSTVVFNAADRLLVVGNGAAAATRSDALVILKNGNTGIGSSTPAARLHVVGNIRMVDGNQAAGRVLVSDANGTGTWTAPGAGTSGTLDQSYDFGGAGAGRTITADAGAVLINGTDGLVSTGTTGSGVLAPSGAGTRMVWNPKKAAFRAGVVDGAQWDNATIGPFSVATGVNTTASGDISTAMGDETTASQYASTAMGSFTTASGSISTAMGVVTTASGFGSTAMGNRTTASGDNSIAMGDRNVAPSYAETVLGLGATTYVPSSASFFGIGQATDRLFVIGNALDMNSNLILDAAERSDALVILKNGNSGFGVSTPVARLQVETPPNASKTQLTQGLLNSGLLVTTDFVAGSYTPGLFWNTTNNNATRPKAGIFLQETNTGSFMYLGTSNNYSTGITNDAVVIDPDGNVGIGLQLPQTALDVLGAVAIRKVGLTTSMIADNQLITVGNRSYIQLQSNLGVATSRTVTLSDGLVAGQLLMIEAVTTGSFEIADNPTNNTDVSVDRAMSISDTIMLLWNGTDWLELNYSDN